MATSQGTTGATTPGSSGSGPTRRPSSPCRPAPISRRTRTATGCTTTSTATAGTDFADVVLYFNQMTWIAANEPVSAFDYNGNGRIDFADVVWLFNNL